ncbi:hypothetical protein ACFQ4C_30175 [Larkinella insperata]|uniref:DUF4136 domain-containing protein n=1 Tax=Larkinella insperata TaxID=332158 RepID=A0ABW3QH62_9BACT
MVTRKLIICLGLLVTNCTQQVIPDVPIQQATKSLSYYLPSDYDISIPEGQAWIARHLDSRFIREQQLDWKLAEDFGYYLDVPFKRTYRGPALKGVFENNELAKLDQTKTDWWFRIAKINSYYQPYIVCYIPFKEFTKRKINNRKSMRDYSKQASYSGLNLSFDEKGILNGGSEVTNGHSQNISLSSTKLPSTQLEEIKKEIGSD